MRICGFIFLKYLSTRFAVEVPFLLKHIYPTPQYSPSYVVDFHVFDICVSVKHVFNNAFS